MKFRGAVLLLLLAGIVLPITAQQKGQGFGKNEAPRCEGFLPDLTEDQQVTIEKLRSEHMNSMVVLRADEDVLRAELNRLEVGGKYDQKAVDSKIDELYDLKAKMAKAKAKHQQDVRNVLTDEQKAVFDAHGGRGFGDGPGFGPGHGHGNCPGNCQGNGQGYGPGDGSGKGKQGCTPACDGKGMKHQGKS